MHEVQTYLRACRSSRMFRALPPKNPTLPPYVNIISWNNNKTSRLHYFGGRRSRIYIQRQSCKFGTRKAVSLNYLTQIRNQPIRSSRHPVYCLDILRYQVRDTAGVLAEPGHRMVNTLSYLFWYTGVAITNLLISSLYGNSLFYLYKGR